jgi:hypothetical protein
MVILQQNAGVLVGPQKDPVGERTGAIDPFNIRNGHPQDAATVDEGVEARTPQTVHLNRISLGATHYSIIMAEVVVNGKFQPRNRTFLGTVG